MYYIKINKFNPEFLKPKLWKFWSGVCARETQQEIGGAYSKHFKPHCTTSLNPEEKLRKAEQRASVTCGGKKRKRQKTHRRSKGRNHLVEPRGSTNPEQEKHTEIFIQQTMVKCLSQSGPAHGPAQKDHWQPAFQQQGIKVSPGPGETEDSASKDARQPNPRTHETNRENWPPYKHHGMGTCTHTRGAGGGECLGNTTWPWLKVKINK